MAKRNVKKKKKDQKFFLYVFKQIKQNCIFINSEHIASLTVFVHQVFRLTSQIFF